MAGKSASKSKARITDQHVKNAQEIAQMLAALKSQQEPEQPEQQAVPSGMSPLGGQAQ
jgi:hypothetical protein